MFSIFSSSCIRSCSCPGPLLLLLISKIISVSGSWSYLRLLIGEVVETTVEGETVVLLLLAIEDDEETELVVIIGGCGSLVI